MSGVLKKIDVTMPYGVQMDIAIDTRGLEDYRKKYKAGERRICGAEEMSGRTDEAGPCLSR